MRGAKHEREIAQRSKRAERIQTPTPMHVLAAIATHELRGPVNTLQAFLSILLREQPGPLNEIQRDFVSSMYVISRRLERFADDIEIMMAEGKGLSIVPREVDITSLVSESVREVLPAAESFGVGITFNSSPVKQWDALVDPVRFSQISVNLIENAARNAVEGTTINVTLRVSVSRILLVVENEAVDQLPEGGLANWFTPFKRGATSSQRAPSGAGLGLAVVSHLVSALGGKVVTRAQGQHVSIAVQLPRWNGTKVPLD